jgi:hypothetical protein
VSWTEVPYAPVPWGDSKLYRTEKPPLGVTEKMTPSQGHNLAPSSMSQCADVAFDAFCRPSSDLVSALQ